MFGGVTWTPIEIKMNSLFLRMVYGKKDIILLASATKKVLVGFCVKLHITMTWGLAGSFCSSRVKSLNSGNCDMKPSNQGWYVWRGLDVGYTGVAQDFTRFHLVCNRKPRAQYPSVTDYALDY